MIEHFTEYQVKTSEDTRKQATVALGFDEPSTSEKLNRADFGSDEAYFDAVAMLAVRHNSPEFREAYTKVRREFNAQQRAEAEAAAAQQHRQELEQAVKDCVLTQKEQAQVDNDARSRAQADLAAGLISYDQFGARVEYYAETGTQAAKVEKVHTADMNKQIREAMRKASGRIL